MQVSEWQLQCAGRGASPPHIFPRRGLQPNSAPASRRHPPRRAASPYFEPSACLRGERCNGRLWLLRNIFVMRSLQQFDIFSQHFLLHYSLTHFTLPPAAPSPFVQCIQLLSLSLFLSFLEGSDDLTMSVLTKTFASRHFFAKFDNTGSGKEADIVSLLTQEQDVMVVTKKHSGSLILIHSIYQGGQWHLVVNSKNGTNNEFSIPAEHYLRTQFKAVHGDAAEEKFTEFVSFLGYHSMTMSFEFVTSFLGDHG